MVRPCCEVCMNKRLIIGNDGNTGIYCDVKETYVSPNDMCQWYDGEHVWRKKNAVKQA